MNNRNKSLLTYVLAIALVAMLALSACRPDGGSSRPNTLQEVQDRGVLRVGYVMYPPWIIRDAKSGELSGASVDAVQEIARGMGVKIEFVEATWGTFIGGLNTKQYDFSITPAYVTIQRALAAGFTEPLWYSGNTVIVRTESKYSDLHDLDEPDVTVTVMQGTQEHEYLRTHFSRAQIHPVSTSDVSLVLSEVLSGRADAAFGDTYSINKFVSAHQDVRNLLPGNPYSILPVAWNVRQSDYELKSFLDASISYLEGNGTLRLFNDKYGVPSEKPRF